MTISRTGKMTKNHKRSGVFLREDGFTLLEVLLAAVMIGTSLLVVMRALGGSITALYRSRHTLVASEFMDQKAKKIEQAAYESDGESIGERRGSFDFKNTRFDWRASKSASKLESIDHVDMEVVWKERGRDRSLRSSIYVYHPPKTDALKA